MGKAYTKKYATVAYVAALMAGLSLSVAFFDGIDSGIKYMVGSLVGLAIVLFVFAIYDVLTLRKISR